MKIFKKKEDIMTLNNENNKNENIEGETKFLNHLKSKDYIITYQYAMENFEYIYDIQLNHMDIYNNIIIIFTIDNEDYEKLNQLKSSYKSILCSDKFIKLEDFNFKTSCFNTICDRIKTIDEFMDFLLTRGETMSLHINRIYNLMLLLQKEEGFQEYGFSGMYGFDNYFAILKSIDKIKCRSY